MPKINFNQNKMDQRVVIMGMTGRHASYIGKECGYSKGQVYTRLHKLGISLRDYRDGKNWVSSYIDTLFNSKDSVRRIQKEIQQRMEANLKNK